jgi:hypothetical protein
MGVSGGNADARLRSRPGHYMPLALLASQRETPEPLAADWPGPSCRPRPAGARSGPTSSPCWSPVPAPSEDNRRSPTKTKPRSFERGFVRFP